MAEITGKRVVLYVDELYNDFEYWYPKYRLTEAGAEVVTAASEAGKAYKSKYGLPATADISYAACTPERFDAVVIPGGYAPDIIRRDLLALNMVRRMDELGKVVAFICHAGWVPISAGVVKGRAVTSFSAIKDDLVNAGALWQDASVVVDRNMITSRKPDDLPDFCRAIIAALKG